MKRGAPDTEKRIFINDFTTPLWFRSFRDELSLGTHYPQDRQERQCEFRVRLRRNRGGYRLSLDVTVKYRPIAEVVRSKLKGTKRSVQHRVMLRPSYARQLFVFV
jgi:hypothetical protein